VNVVTYRFPSLLLASGGSTLRKEDKTMTYTKPEVSTLGNAASVIESIPVPGKNSSQKQDVGGLRFHDPAYDLDE
jgi:hypothetical protein